MSPVAAPTTAAGRTQLGGLRRNDIQKFTTKALTTPAGHAACAAQEGTAGLLPPNLRVRDPAPLDVVRFVAKLGNPPDSAGQERHRVYVSAPSLS